MLQDNQAEIAAQMRRLLAEKTQNSAGIVAQPDSTISTEVFADWVPGCAANEFLVKVPLNDKVYVCAIQEPTWKEAASIELYAFRKTPDGKDYFAGEHERRELLRKTLCWIADPNDQNIHIAPRLNELEYAFVNALWSVVSTQLFVQLEEARVLYASARAFFAGEIGRAVHPIILDVDGIIKHMFVFNAAEWNAVSMSNFERYQIVWMAYNEHTAKSQDNLPPPDIDQPSLKAFLGRVPK